MPRNVQCLLKRHAINNIVALLHPYFEMSVTSMSLVNLFISVLLQHSIVNLFISVML